MKATAVAHPNIALVKYWGKRDEALILPHQSSLSVTLAPISVTTTVEFGAPEERVELNGRRAEGGERARILRLIDEVRREAGSRQLGPVAVVSRGDFPEAAGLASSAAGFAALAVAARGAAGLSSSSRAASILARLGSGSAARSIQGGTCVWHRGQQADGSDSFAEQVFPEAHWPELRLWVAIVSSQEKKVKSRDGMRHTVETSPYYAAWVKDAEAEVPRAVEAMQRKDLAALGELAERNAWRMHATAMGAAPPLCYLLPKTLEIIQGLAEARESGLRAWFTLDAGPNPVLLTDASGEGELERFLRGTGVEKLVRCVPGGDARLV